MKPLGEENYDYITKNKVKNILNERTNMLTSLMKEVHFNEEHPENWNYFIANKRSDKALVIVVLSTKKKIK